MDILELGIGEQRAGESQNNVVVARLVVLTDEYPCVVREDCRGGVYRAVNGHISSLCGLVAVGQLLSGGGACCAHGGR